MNKNSMITPRATEKAYNLESQRTYVFYVPRSASKQSIAKAIAEAFNVTVTSVRVLNRKGKLPVFRAVNMLILALLTNRTTKSLT